MIGVLIVLVSSAFFCIQNVIVRVLFNEQTLFGVFHTGGFVAPTLPNSFLLMFMRMLLAVPLMAVLAFKLYPPMWQEIGQLRTVAQRPRLLRAIAGGMLMFLYLALLYVSMGLIPVGIAITLFFSYPVFTALFSWRFFGDRPTVFRWSVMGLVLFGSALTLPHVSPTMSHASTIGILTGAASGIAYAVYTIVAQKSFETVHPVPFTWLSFLTAMVLSGISLLFWHENLWQQQGASLPWLPLWIGGLLSAIVTFAGHLLNNLGIRRIGATTASMIGASNPALTVVVAWFVIQETLNSVQVVGVAIVTLSVALLSGEKGKAKEERLKAEG